MENVLCEVGVLVRERAAHIVTGAAAGFCELLELRYDLVVASDAAPVTSAGVVDLASTVEAHYYVVALAVCKLYNIIVNEHTVRCEREAEILTRILLNGACVSYKLFHNIKIHKRLAAKEVDLEISSAA